MPKLRVEYTRVSKVWELAKFEIEVPDDATQDQIDDAVDEFYEANYIEFKETDSETISTSYAAWPGVITWTP